MKPEDGFHEAVERGGQIVAVADMAVFVGDDGFELRFVEVIGDVCGEIEDRAEDSEYAWL